MDFDMFLLFFLLSACFLCGLGGAWLISRHAFQWGLVDVPSLRSSHSRPTPRGGGVGIVAAMAVGGIVLARPLWFWGGPVLLALVCLFDDRLKLSVRTRLFFQFAAAGIWILSFWNVWDFTMRMAVIAVFWAVFIVGSANFFNFMDGIDGMAGISGAVGFGLLALFGFAEAHAPQAWFCLAVAAACLGFLPFNLPKAKVFMGDVGSIPLGFVFGALVFSMSAGPADFLCLISFLFLFYADAASTLFIRWHRGERLSQPHRRHLYQLMSNELKNSHFSISLSYGGWQLGTGLLMFLSWRAGLVWQIVFLLLLTGAFLLMTYKVRRAASCQSEGAR